MVGPNALASLGALVAILVIWGERPESSVGVAMSLQLVRIKAVTSP